MADKLFDFVVRSAVDTKDDKTRWREVGVGWKGKDSITLSLDALPVNGKLIIFPYTPPEQKTPANTML